MWDLKSRYLPAVSGAMMNMGWKLPAVEAGHPDKMLTFWQDNGFLDKPYKYMLVSAFYGIAFQKGKEQSFREMCDVGKDVYILGDSGGFQAVSQQKILDPADVIAWQNQNCTTGLILDVPPYEMAKSREDEEEEGNKSFLAQFGAEKDFEGSLKYTLKNATVMKKGQKELLNLYGVIQGNTKEKAIRWFKTLKHLDFEGWSLAPKPSGDPDTLQWWLELAYEYLEDAPLHILQIGSPLAVAMTTRFCYKKYKGTITYDNSTPLKLATNYRGYMDRDGGNVLLGSRGQGEKEDTKKFLAKYLTAEGKLACPCNVCQTVPLELFQNAESNGALYMALHNIQAYNVMHEYIKSIAVDTDKLRMFFARLDPKLRAKIMPTRRPITAIMDAIDNIGSAEVKVQQRLFG